MHAELATSFNSATGCGSEARRYRALALIDEHGVKLRSRRGLSWRGLPATGRQLGNQLIKAWCSTARLWRSMQRQASFGAMQNRASPTERGVLLLRSPLFRGVDLRGHATPTPPLSGAMPAARLGTAGPCRGRRRGCTTLRWQPAGRSRGKRKNSTMRQASAHRVLKVKPRTAGLRNRGTRRQGCARAARALLLGYCRKQAAYASHVGSVRRPVDQADEGVARAAAAQDQSFLRGAGVERADDWVEPSCGRSEVPGWTDDHHLRAPVFPLADDIDAKEVGTSRKGKSIPSSSEVGQSGSAEDRQARLRLPLAHTSPLTHLDRVYWPADPALKQPALTKRDLLRYFAQVSSFILRTSRIVRSP